MNSLHTRAARLAGFSLVPLALLVVGVCYAAVRPVVPALQAALPPPVLSEPLPLALDLPSLLEAIRPVQRPGKAKGTQGEPKKTWQCSEVEDPVLGSGHVKARVIAPGFRRCDWR